MNRIDVFVSARLAAQYCNSSCWHRTECNPKIYQESSAIDSSLTLRVLGQMLCSECPIMCRELPSAGWAAAGHDQWCGYTQPGDDQE